MTESWVAVICLNDYPHSVTKSFADRKEAEKAADQERLRLIQEGRREDAKLDPMSRRPRYYHIHTFKQPS